MSTAELTSYRVLDAYVELRKHPERWWRVAELAERIGVDRAAAMRYLRALEARGMAAHKLESCHGAPSEGASHFKFKDALLRVPA